MGAVAARGTLRQEPRPWSPRRAPPLSSPSEPPLDSDQEPEGAATPRGGEAPTSCTQQIVGAGTGVTITSTRPTSLCVAQAQARTALPLPLPLALSPLPGAPLAPSEMAVSGCARMGTSEGPGRSGGN